MTPFLQEGSLKAHSYPLKNKNAKTFIYRSDSMDKIVQTVYKISALKTPIIIAGESGVGKNLLAFQIHKKSSRHHGPFVKINCEHLNPQVLEAELFGFKGSRTTSSTEGALRKADGGTLVINEITKMPLSVQKRFKTFLKMGLVTPVGAKTSIPVNVRVIYTLNDEKPLVTNSHLNKLYTHMKAFHINLPKLSQRREDIPDLMRYFLSLESSSKKTSSRKKLKISDKAMEALKYYQWPGNVKELKDMCKRFQTLCQGPEITVSDLPRYVLDTDECIAQISYDPKLTLSEINRLYILSALKHFPSKRRAADALGITVKTLYNRLHEYGVFDRYALHNEQSN